MSSLGNEKPSTDIGYIDTPNDETIDINPGEICNLEINITDSNKNAVMDDVVFAVIYDTRNKIFFNGFMWTDIECQISMPHIENGKYSITFTPDTESIFNVKVKSENYPFGYTKIIRTMKELGAAPIQLSNINFKNQDGTDSLLIDKQGRPIQGVKISCFDTETKDIVGISQTNAEGEWNMMIPAGKYFFTFEKDGYISVSFERSVF